MPDVASLHRRRRPVPYDAGGGPSAFPFPGPEDPTTLVGRPPFGSLHRSPGSTMPGPGRVNPDSRVGLLRNRDWFLSPALDPPFVFTYYQPRARHRLDSAEQRN